MKSRIVFAALIFFAARLFAETELYVAADGSAKFKSVEEAIMSVPSGSRENPVIIHIAPGTYHELIYIQREKRFFKLVGDNATNTFLTYDLYAGITNAEGKPIGTFKTPSTTIDADDFSAENLTFENSAGPVGQALAIRVDGDRATFRRCDFLGWQDTILINRGRQYFENCYINGHVDFIFGAATAWFEKCTIHARRDGYLTAASTPQDVPFGYVFDRCQLTGEPGVKTYLGRPWRQFGSVTYLNCDLSEVIRPEGWNDWKKPHETIRYAEYNSTGVGANPAARADWSKQLTAAEAKKITVEKVLGGNDGWNPTLPVLDPKIAATKYDIEYGEAGGQKLLLDAHVPAGDGKFPVVLIVHGGGWMTGDRETDIVPVFAPVATNFTWFTIYYRLAPTNRWPACIDDVNTAIRWVKAHAAEYKGDPDRIALLGYSAGGHLVTLAGTHPDKPNAILKFSHLTGKSSTEVQAVVAFAPPTDLVADNERRGGLSTSMQNLFDFGTTNITDSVRAVLKKNSPLTYVKPGLPPFLLINGTADKTVPFGQTENFYNALKAAKVDATLVPIPEGQHRIADWKKFVPDWQQQLKQWLEAKLAAK
ncbi:MAG TPA: pectinesterase family protein [Candidatus Sulfotelmatobacter sp.]|jgi:pectinesterase|nr:pectinesterase family protein [Candidatus Sulfotelmatobacter sp.]